MTCAAAKWPFLPSVGLFHQFPVRVVNVHGNLRLLDFGPEPKPIFVSFEQLLPHGLFLAGAEIATPVIFAHLETFFDVRLRGLERERLRVIDRTAKPTWKRTRSRTRRRARRRRLVSQGSSHRSRYGDFFTIASPRRVVISLIFFTEAGEMRASPTSISGRTSTKAPSEYPGAVSD